jgi:hypothetical protein
MTDQETPTPIAKLQSHVAALEEENRRLRGQHVPSAAAVALQRENTDLRRQLAADTPRPAGAAFGEYLTLPQVAQTIHVSTYQILRDLRDSLPMAVDAQGNTVVARRDVHAFLLAQAQGRSTRRFL